MTVIRTGSAGIPTPAIVPSTTRVPSQLPSIGAMKPSPQGRLPKAFSWPSSPASGIATRSPRPSRKSVPFGQVMWALSEAVSRSATAPPLRRSSSMSALITRASIASVTPGSVAIRAPASDAALREAVCESDWIVGAMTTSAAFIAAATVAGGSAAWVARSAISARTASAPARPASPRSRSPRPRVAGLATTRTSSPSLTWRQSWTTALTARSSSAGSGGASGSNMARA